MSETKTAAAHAGSKDRAHVNIFINDVRHEVGADPLTGAQIASLGGIPDGNQLFLEVPGPGDDDPIARDQVIEPRSGMRFYDVPAGNLG